MNRRIKHFPRVLDAPSLNLVGPVEIDEVYVSVGKKVRERDQEVAIAWPVTRGSSSYGGDKPSIFIIADLGTGQQYVIPAEATDEWTIRLLLADRQ